MSDTQTASAVEEVKKRISDLAAHGLDEYDVRRFVVARQNNVEQATSMLQDHLKWRAKTKPEEVLVQVPLAVFDLRPGGHCNFDKDGRPVFYERSGMSDLPGVLRSATEKEILDHEVRLLEATIQACRAQSEKLGRRIETWTLVMDFRGFGLKHLWRPGLNTFIKISQQADLNYPERMGRILIVNAPSVFHVAHKIVRPFLSEAINSKVLILGGDALAALSPYIDPTALPKFLGGSCSSGLCAEGGRLTLDDYTVPESLYRSTAIEGDLKEEVIARGSSFQLDIPVTETGSTITWEFSTVGFDLEFGVFWKPDASKKLSAKEMDEVQPTERVASHLCNQTGGVTCEKCGVYVLRWSNTFSWTRPKQLRYTTEVLPPATDTS